ncbi:hypothetical protein CIB48_g3760 [Xylaria polymorpha]|nr:hypothetical protein CIB48_g3760 [Xylaria polymorpha]
MDRTSFSDRRPSTVDYTTAPPPPGYQTSKPSGALLNFGQSTNGFAQPSYGPISASNPQSTPVSPAQTVFPQGPNVNLPPPPSPNYSNPAYQPYEQSEAEGKRHSTSYPLISAKPPPRATEPRSSISSNVSMENTPRPILPSISFPNPSESSPYSEYSGYQLKGGLYPQAESRQVKRTADESFPSHQQQMRDVRGDRLPMQPIYPSSTSYTRADGKRAFPPSHLWLS